MATYSRIKQKQLLQEAEGYLDLSMVLADQYRLTPASRDRVATRALETLDRLDEETRDSCIGLHLRGEAYRVMERYEEAIEPLLQAKEAEPENVNVMLALGWCYKRTKKIDLAINALEDALAAGPEEAIIHYNLACYWSLAKNVPLALIYLSQSFDLDSSYRNMVDAEPDFDPMRDHPEFQALINVTV